MIKPKYQFKHQFSVSLIGGCLDEALRSTFLASIDDLSYSLDRKRIWMRVRESFDHSIEEFFETMLREDYSLLFSKGDGISDCKVQKLFIGLRMNMHSVEYNKVDAHLAEHIFEFGYSDLILLRVAT